MTGRPEPLFVPPADPRLAFWRGVWVGLVGAALLVIAGCAMFRALS